jgi:hypothetical protein
VRSGPGYTRHPVVLVSVNESQFQHPPIYACADSHEIGVTAQTRICCFEGDQLVRV